MAAANGSCTEAATSGLGHVTLVKYDAACRALAQARSVDEVRKIRDGAAAMRAYAKQAQNKQLEIDAVEIRVRAERRVGELMAAQRQTVGLAQGKRTDLGPKRPQVDKPTLADAGIDKHLAKRARKLAAVPAEKFEANLANWRAGVERSKRRVTSDVLVDDGDRLAVHHSSETPEHYTPQPFLDAVRQVLGTIDLDPCSNSRETPNVRARAYYTREDDGLRRAWHGRVFMNPPYGREIVAWIEKLRTEWRRPEVEEVIALLPARTDTEWFEQLTFDTDDPVVCFLRGRLTFVGNDDPAPFPSMAIYFGPKHDRFAEVFIKLGSLWQRPATPLEWFVSHE